MSSVHDTLSNFDWGSAITLAGVALGALITQWPHSRRFRAEERREKEAANDKDLKIAAKLSRDLREVLDEYIQRIEEAGTIHEQLWLEEFSTSSIGWAKPGAKVPKAMITYHSNVDRKVDTLFSTALLKLKNLTVREKRSSFNTCGKES